MKIRNVRYDIPWKEYTEKEVQGILFQYFISVGYKVDWFHLEDKTEEKKAACDLLCKKSQETVGIAVKKHPRAEDIDQVRRLARKKYSKRVYVYIRTPTPSFRKVAEGYHEKVEFWNPEHIERMLEGNEVGLAILHDILYSNSNLLDNMIRFVQDLKIQVRARDKNLEPQAKPLKELWRLKDEIVFLHTSDTLLLGILEDKWIEKEITEKALFALYLHTLKLYGSALGSFRQTWKVLLVKNAAILQKVYNRYAHTSPWKNLWAYQDSCEDDLLSKPGILKEHLHELRKIDVREYEEREERFFRLKKEAGEEYSQSSFMMEVVREKFLRRHLTFFICLEDIVDQMFEI